MNRTLSTLRRITMLTAVLGMFTTPEAAVSSPLGQLSFTDKVKGVTDPGFVNFEKQESYRLWGIIPDSEYLRTLLVGETLVCTLAGQTMSNQRYVRAVECSFAGTEWKPADTINFQMIKSGHASEFCLESLGWFGTCENIEGKPI